MKNPPTKLTPKLHSTPEEMLRATRHHYAQKINDEIKLAIPMMLRPSVEYIVLRGMLFASICALIVFLIKGDTNAAFLIWICVTPISALLCKKTPGILALTDHEYVLIALENKLLADGTIVERVPRPVKLPQPSTHKGQIRGGPLPFGKKEKEGWHYAATCMTNDKFLDVIKRLVEADSSRRNLDPVEEPALV